MQKQNRNIYKLIKLSLAGIFILCINWSCDKEKGSSIYKVWYLLEVPNKFDINIAYYSDKYAATGNLETIHYTDTTYSPFTATLSETSSKIKCWVGNHVQKDRNTPYYIDVEFNDSTKFDYTNGKKYVLMVFANDTSLIDSIQFTPTYNKLHLTGNIPEKF
jgi:hypothetical protein